MPNEISKEPVAKGKAGIKKAFLKLYSEMPLNKIRVHDITELARVSRSTFYSYFEDIYDLYNQCETEMIRSIEGDLTDIILSTVVKDEKKYISLIKENLQRSRSLIDDALIFFHGSERGHFMDSWLESGSKAFEKTMDFGRTLPEAKRKMILRFFVHGQMILYADWFEHKGTIPDEYIAETLAQMLFQGAFLQKPM